MQDEWDKFTGWISTPFTTQIPLWQLFVIFGIFCIIAYVVWDNLDILKTGLAAPAEAVASAV